MMNTTTTPMLVKNSYFTLFLRRLFPIQPENRKKVGFLLILFFLVSFVYNILQVLKKNIIIHTPGAGSEAIPYLKPFAVVPGAFLLTWFFLALQRHFNRDAVFKIILLTFISYFMLYTFILIPFKDYFALNTLADFLLEVLPPNFHEGPSLVRYWMHTVFYAFSELWSSTILSLLLWGLVNEISTHEEAKASYALLTLGANCSGMFAGIICSALTKLPYNPNFFYGHNHWDQAFLRIMLVVFLSCSLILVVYGYFVRCGYTAAIAQDPKKIIDKIKNKASIVDCFYQVLRSKNLLYLTMIVMGYNIVYNLSDVVFTKRVELSFGHDKAASAQYFSMVMMCTSFVSTIFALVITNISLSSLGWTSTALITPIVYFVSGSFFYLSQVDLIQALIGYASWDLIALYAGAAHMCLTKGAKYSVFDSTKEMAYIGLTKEERVNGKAAIDGIVSRFGKSGGSAIFFFLYAILGNNILFTIPYLYIIIGVIICLWMLAIVNLGRYQNSDVKVVLTTS